MSHARVVAAVLAAAAVTIGGVSAVETGVIPKWEGKKNVGYADKLAGGLPTTCYGNTSRAIVGKYYPDEKCAELLAEDAVRHGLEIAKCLPDELPVQTRAAFQSVAFNIGSAKFCGDARRGKKPSSMSRKAMAGDLWGACAAISLYTFVGDKDCRDPKNKCAGLPARRVDERALCERGLMR